MNPYTEVLFEEISGTNGNLGMIILNRPAVLNSLNHSMVKAMYDQLQAWAVADHIKAVVIRAAEGRAFCAGGDLRLTYDRIRSHDPIMAHFFHDEYLLNRFIFHFPKPYIALLDGITMGGGVGISIHGSHRVATERLLFAMPETGIGFFPDVGGTFFLPRLPGYVGYYLGLVGARIASDDCVALGIAQQKVAPEVLPALIDALAQCSFENDARGAVTAVINKFKLPSQTSPLMKHQSALDGCFAGKTMEEILLALQNSEDKICQQALSLIAKKSPTSLKVTLQALHDGKNLDFDVCMRQEYRLTCRFLKEQDFAEGIRAVIIDKDQNPQWNPSILEEVTSSMVKKYFAPLAEELA